MSREARVSGIEIDLNALRGWSERPDTSLRKPHALPELGRLVQLGRDEGEVCRYGFHGTDVVVGRYRPQVVPVDLEGHLLRDAERYRLSAPHAQFRINQGIWQIKALSPPSQTKINGDALGIGGRWVSLESGDLVQLGVARFRFESSLDVQESWEEAREALLGRVRSPAVFLKRGGGLCGAFRVLPEEDGLELGRSFPAAGTLPETESWPAAGQLTWNLSGLYGHERACLGFRHARISLKDGRWIMEPLSSRQRTYVNRIATAGPVELEGGDEIGLGSVLLEFYHPHRRVKGRRVKEVPAAVDWSEGRPPRRKGP